MNDIIKLKSLSKKLKEQSVDSTNQQLNDGTDIKNEESI